MVRRREARRLGKYVLSLSQLRLLYARITLTRYTTWYFLFALVTAGVLVVLQALTYADNASTRDLIHDLLQATNQTKGIPIIGPDNTLRICDGVTTDIQDCTALGIGHKGGKREFYYAFSSEMEKAGKMGFDLTQIHRRDHHIVPEHDNQGNINGTNFGGYYVDLKCSASLLWVEDILGDATREDIVTLCFHIWLFLLAIVTILNESLPHLFVGIAGHSIGTTWAGSRIAISRNLSLVYDLVVVKGSCHGVDPLGSWWQARTMRAIPILAVNATAALTAIYFSAKLYQVYSVQTFSRVGSSPKAHSVYKLVLLLSVGLQLTAFFMICSTSIWLDKLLRSQTRYLADHVSLYIAAFALVAGLIIPWHVFGWISVRRENRSQFLMFCVISVAFIVISGMLFASLIYRFIFDTWPFFAVVTVASFMLLVGTFVLGLICRCRFGSDFPQLLKAREVPEGADFAPVYLDSPDDQGDSEKQHLVIHIEDIEKPEPARTAPARTFSSLFTDANGETIKLSTTPSFLDKARLSSLWTSRSNRSSFVSTTTQSTLAIPSRAQKAQISTSSANPKPF